MEAHIHLVLEVKQTTHCVVSNSDAIITDLKKRNSTIFGCSLPKKYWVSSKQCFHLISEYLLQQLVDDDFLPDLLLKEKKIYLGPLT